ncbi:MAG: PTS sugar transporter subunit IIA [Candidatus Aminicenantia bacterium]
MIGGIIVSHGSLAKEMLDVLSAILGYTPPIEVLSIGWFNDVEKLRNELEGCIKRANRGKGVIIFTDIFGGSPSNIAFSFLEENQIGIITGVNLPMLIKFSQLPKNISLKEAMSELKKSGQEGIIVASELLSEKSKK